MLVRAPGRRLQVIRLAIRLYRTFKRIERATRRGVDQATVEALYAAAGRDIRDTANRLCGAIVKAGQFLSLREELFPLAFTRELAGLQDDVPPARFADIRGIVAEACPQPLEQVYRRLDERPVASGSIAQVHRAELMDGQVVAVKVLRPDIERIVAVDMATLGHVARLARRIPALRNRIDFVALHRAFSETLALELDMRAEAEHMDRIREVLGGERRIVIPGVFPTLCAPRVLVMSYVVGANIRDADQLAAWGVDRAALRDALLDAYFTQLLAVGFVHLDPHPGNLVVLPAGKLGLLDFGMVAAYRPEERAAFRNLLQRAFLRDAEGVARLLQSLGFLRPDVDAAKFAREVAPSLRPFDGKALRSLLGRADFRVEAKYMLLVRCLGMLKTALTTLTPEENDWPGVLVDHAMQILLGGMDKAPSGGRLDP